MTDFSAIDRRRCHPASRLRVLAAGVVVGLALTVASGCCRSAGEGWAQNSPVIERGEETVNFAPWPEKTNENN